jgi:hypothetical protein
MMEFGPKDTKTLYNWMMSGVISADQFKRVLDDGKVAKGKQKQALIKYSQLQVWKLV